MNTLSKNVLCVAAAVMLLLVGAQAGFGQNATTGTLSGVVMDAQKGVLPGATVTAVHTPTGTTYEAVTQADGHFTMNAVRVGGPYTIKVTMSGFKDAEQKDINVALGEVREVEFTLGLATVTETVNVVAEAQMIDTQRAGTASNIAAQTINALPTINRSINDFARTSPVLQRDVRQRGRHRVRQRGGPEQPLQQHADRRRGQQRRVRPRRHRHAGRPDGHAADQPRRHPGNPAARLALRRAPGRVLGRRHQRHHQERHQRLPRRRLLRGPQPDAHRRHPAPSHPVEPAAGRHEGGQVHRQAVSGSPSAGRS